MLHPYGPVPVIHQACFKIGRVFGTAKSTVLESWQVGLFKQHSQVVSWQVFPEYFEHNSLDGRSAKVHSNRERSVFLLPQLGQCSVSDAALCIHFRSLFWHRVRTYTMAKYTASSCLFNTSDFQNIDWWVIFLAMGQALTCLLHQSSLSSYIETFNVGTAFHRASCCKGLCKFRANVHLIAGQKHKMGGVDRAGKGLEKPCLPGTDLCYIQT